MKINEIIVEDDMDAGANLAELSANVIPVLMFLKTQAEERGVSAKMRTDSLIRMIKNAGDTTFDYKALIAAHENSDAVKEMIKSVNRDEVVLASDELDAEDQEVTGQDAGEGPDQYALSPEEQVSSMAKKAAGARGAAV